MWVLKLMTNDKEEKTWIPVKSLCGRAILLGSNAFVIPSVEEVYGAIHPDCIYFTDDWREVMTDDIQAGRHDIVVYNLKYDSLDWIICPLEHLLSRWLLPIWFY